MSRLDFAWLLAAIRRHFVNIVVFDAIFLQSISRGAHPVAEGCPSNVQLDGVMRAAKGIRKEFVRVDEETAGPARNKG
jgi:hypothetical protein